MNTYNDLPDEEKIRIAKDAVAYGIAIPEPIRTFLVGKGIYDLVANPVGD